jgi:hypothetical protein
MSDKLTFDEWMARIRREICATCPLRQEGGPPCPQNDPLCALELRADEVIEMVRSDLDHPFPEAVYKALYRLQEPGPVS